MVRERCSVIVLGVGNVVIGLGVRFSVIGLKF